MSFKRLCTATLIMVLMLMFAACGGATPEPAAPAQEAAPSGYTDTDVTLITDNAVDGVDSQDTVFGLENSAGATE